MNQQELLEKSQNLLKNFSVIGMFDLAEDVFGRESMKLTRSQHIKPY